MTEKYRGFIIQENNIECTYKEEKFIVINYLVYKEADGKRYFLPKVTAFDTVEEAKEVIDKILEK